MDQKKPNRLADLFKQLFEEDVKPEMQVKLDDAPHGKNMHIKIKGDLSDQPTVKQLCIVCNKEFDLPVVAYEEAKKTCPKGMKMGLCCEDCSDQVNSGKKSFQTIECNEDDLHTLNEAADEMNEVEGLMAAIVPTILASNPLHKAVIHKRASEFSGMFNEVMQPLNDDESLEPHERFRAMLKAYLTRVLEIVDNPPPEWTK